MLQRSRPLLQTWRVGGLLGLLVVLTIASGSFQVWESVQRGEFISALAARDPERFQQALLTFIGILLATALLLSFVAFLRDTLGLRWRQGLTRQFLEDYLGDRHYYRLTLPSSAPDVDNPDQRLSEDIRQVTQTLLLVGVIALESAVQLTGFIGVLWVISTTLTGFLVVYAGVGTAIAVLFFGQRLTRINAEQLKREANFRFGLINVRENAESIAFYRGQRAEGTVLNHFFAGVVANFNRLIRWQLGLDFFSKRLPVPHLHFAEPHPRSQYFGGTVGGGGDRPVSGGVRSHLALPQSGGSAVRAAHYPSGQHGALGHPGAVAANPRWAAGGSDRSPAQFDASGTGFNGADARRPATLV